jgi:hypothetical protein
VSRLRVDEEFRVNDIGRVGQRPDPWPLGIGEGTADIQGVDMKWEKTRRATPSSAGWVTRGVLLAGAAFLIVNGIVNLTRLERPGEVVFSGSDAQLLDQQATLSMQMANTITFVVGLVMLAGGAALGWAALRPVWVARELSAEERAQRAADREMEVAGHHRFRAPEPPPVEGPEQADDDGFIRVRPADDTVEPDLQWRVSPGDSPGDAFLPGRGIESRKPSRSPRGSETRPPLTRRPEDIPAVVEAARHRPPDEFLPRNSGR